MSEDRLPPKIPGLEPDRRWLAENARVTAFAMPGLALTPLRWKDVFGADPDQVVRQPGMPSMEGGPIDGKRWLIGQQPGRVDVIVVPESPPVPSSDVLNVGEFGDVIDPLLEAAERAFDQSASILRLAVGAILFEPVDTIRDGLRKLQTSVPQLQRLPEGATDLFFQLNVPVSIDDVMPGLGMNRLLKWQVAAMQILGFAPGLGMSFQIAPTGMRQLLRLELDINTSFERTAPLPSDKIGQLIARLGSEAKDLAKAGGFAS